MVVQIEYLEVNIEDIYYPYPAKKISQVIDILTDQTVIPIDGDFSHFDLKVYAKNLYDKEISLLIGENSIILNLDPLDSFPLVPKDFRNKDIINSESNLRHVKIDIKYLLTNPNGTRFKNFFRILSSVQISSFPNSIHITSPLGYRICGSKEGYQIGLDLIKKSNTDKDQSTNYKMCGYAPFICEKQGKRIYNYFINYNETIEKFGAPTEDTLMKDAVRITYISKIEPIVIITTLLIPFLFLCFSFAIIIAKFNFIEFSIIDTPNNSFSFLMILLSYFYFHHSYIKEGRYIPYRNFFYVVLLISFIAFFILAFSNPNSPDLSQITNISNVSQITNISNVS